MNQEIDFLLSPQAIRDRAKKLFERCQNGNSHFIYHPDKLGGTVEFVLDVIRRKYPDLNIPFHSRWGHFRVGNIDRVNELESKLKEFSAIEKARIKLDLVISSVLLDAGAGIEWKYLEGKQCFSRSEGLGVASFHMFMSGIMSHNKKSLKADGEGLKNITVADLKTAFQVSSENPLVGVDGRLKLLNNLYLALQNKKIFKDSRPGNIIDYLSEKFGNEIPAVGILRAVLDGLGPIWPGRIVSSGVNLGDVWRHSTLASKDSIDSLVPIHKLSQWMTYSLIEPIVEAGFIVSGVEELTGLAEYRNGGLMIDSGLLSFRNIEDSHKSWSPDSDLIIEWRALTIYLLDEIAVRVQKALNKSPQDFPLAKVLEGGTWWAGRELAAKNRVGATPPIQITSDGTVF